MHYKLNRSFLFVALLLMFLCYNSDVQAVESENRFSVGLTYVNGLHEVTDFIDDDLQALGYDVDTLAIPVGLTLVGGYRFGSGIEIMADVGPLMIIYMD